MRPHGNILLNEKSNRICALRLIFFSFFFFHFQNKKEGSTTRSHGSILLNEKRNKSCALHPHENSASKIKPGS